MLTPAEELLAAVKEHATASDEFGFQPEGRLVVTNHDATKWTTVTFRDPIWYAYHENDTRGFAHDSASSAVQSAFARARGKQP